MQPIMPGGIMANEAHTIDTPFGGKLELRLYPGRVYFSTPADCHLTINRVEYCIRGGLRFENNEWISNRDSPLNFNRNGGVYRSQWDEHTKSANARKKFEEAVYPLIIEWLTSDAGAEALRQGELASIDREISDKDREIREATELIARLNAERTELQERRNKLAK